MINGEIRWPLATSSYQQLTGIYKNGALIATASLYGGHASSLSVSDIVSLAASDVIKLYGYHTHTTSADIVQGSLTVHRIS
jgi:hypothetical protein